MAIINFSEIVSSGVKVSMDVIGQLVTIEPTGEKSCKITSPEGTMIVRVLPGGYLRVNDQRKRPDRHWMFPQ